MRRSLAGVPVSDYDAMERVWAGLVRRNGASDRGKPDARDIAMLQLVESGVGSVRAFAGGLRRVAGRELRGFDFRRPLE